MTSRMGFRRGIAMVSAAFGLGAVGAHAAQLPGMGEMTGSVKAAKAFKSAKVYAFNKDRQIKYMVFTENGAFRATNMYPGTYTVTIDKPGLKAAPATITIEPGKTATLNIAAKTAPVAPTYIGGQVYPDTEIQPYNKIYPAGAGRDIIERTCQGCHTVQLFPYNVKRTYPTGRNLKDKAAWAITVDRMHKGPAFGERGVGYWDAKLLKPGEREVLIDYLAKNFGADSKPRVVQQELPDPPLDEKMLGKAQYITYFFPNVAGKPDRFTQQIDFCKGEVYIADRGLPGLVKLDPTTGKHVDIVGHGGGHGITTDENCGIWYTGETIRHYDPSTDKHDSYVIEKGAGLGSITTMFNTKGDLWMAMLGAGKIAKWERTTDTVKYWDLPQPGLTYGKSRPYGLVLDQKERVWFGEYHKSSIGMFDPATETYKSFRLTPLAPTNIRRLGVDSKGHVWASTWGRPNLVKGGSMFELDPESGKVTEYPIGIPYTNPYDTKPDEQDNVWASTDNYLIRIDAKTRKMTRYPAPSRTDIPMMTIGRNGGVWFTDRGAGQSGAYGGTASVLYPDKDAITEFAAYFGPNNTANHLSKYQGPPPPKAEGVIKESPNGAQNSATPGNATAPKILGPVKPDSALGHLE
ncbi:carboxypeptidase regulatory-like domain-containing protein [Sphingomonas montanisoli]|nr:carboxypeptidase regulatory-like domain-containing protein [Sphingomonas montanisoli]